MLKKAGRVINSKCARMMCTWSHYKFHQLLCYKASVTGAVVHIANEAYTSKTCCRCGVLRDKLGGAKTFLCRACGLCIDRDINGAINICLRQCSR
jgi:putative transposase